jgi:hypothetical protein
MKKLLLLLVVLSSIAGVAAFAWSTYKNSLKLDINCGELGVFRIEYREFSNREAGDMYIFEVHPALKYYRLGRMQYFSVDVSEMSWMRFNWESPNGYDTYRLSRDTLELTRKAYNSTEPSVKGQCKIDPEYENRLKREIEREIEAGRTMRQI